MPPDEFLHGLLHGPYNLDRMAFAMDAGLVEYVQPSGDHPYRSDPGGWRLTERGRLLAENEPRKAAAYLP